MEGQTRPPRRGLGPLLGALALAALVGGVAMAVALHGRSTAQRGTPTPTPDASSPRPSTPAFNADVAPVTGAGTVAAWDSTHIELVTYTPSDSQSVPGSVWTWNGTWHSRSVLASSPTLGGVLVDAPALHGVVLVTAAGVPPHTAASNDTWLWDGFAWKQLPTAAFQHCMAPSSGAWDPTGGRAVVVASDQCTGGRTVVPSETWLFDGRAWTRQGTAPAGVLWPVLTYDTGARRVVMLQGPGADDPTAGNREWSWTGAGWAAAGTLPGAPAPDQLVGAAWDGRAGGVVALTSAAGPPLAYVVAQGTWSVLHAPNWLRRVAAVAEDTAQGRILALAQRPETVNGTPVAAAGDYYLATWDGTAWRVL